MIYSDYTDRLAAIEREYDALRTPLLANFHTKLAPLVAAEKAACDMVRVEYGAKTQFVGQEYWDSLAPVSAERDEKLAKLNGEFRDAGLTHDEDDEDGDDEA